MNSTSNLVGHIDLPLGCIQYSLIKVFALHTCIYIYKYNHIPEKGGVESQPLA